MSATYEHHLYRQDQDEGDTSVTHPVTTDGQNTVACGPGLWPDGAWTGQANASGEHLYASVAAQRRIWQHQHVDPNNCHSQNFFLYESDSVDTHGIGSTIHVVTWALAEAISHDRILLFAPTLNGIWSQGTFCLDHDNLHDCYFEPISSCTYAEAIHGTSLSAIEELDFAAQSEQQKLRVVRSSIDQLATRIAAQFISRKNLVKAQTFIGSSTHSRAKTVFLVASPSCCLHCSSKCQNPCRD